MLIFFSLYCFPFFFFFTVQRDLWDINSLIRDQTHALRSGNAEFEPLDCQGSPYFPFYLDQMI